MIGPDTAAWQQLQRLADAGAGRDVRADFLKDSARGARYTRQAAGVALDLSHQGIDETIYAQLLALLDQIDLRSSISAMFTGEPINRTEGRAVLHAALRQRAGDAVGGSAVEQAVLAERERMLAFAEAVRASGRYDTVINIGIGGSDLGPAMAVAALKDFSRGAPRLHFVSNVDGCALHDALEQANPERTLFIICSKTFTTQETMANADRAKAWLLRNRPGVDIREQFAAVSVNATAMDAFGVHPAQRFAMWDWVGGRYSVWSAIGLALAISIGRDGFTAFLDGARAMDRHFIETPWADNLPALFALVGVWNINFQRLPTLAVLPYSDRLARFPAFLQQLEMESNGKSVLQDGSPARCATAPVIWGEPGNNAQHSFFQMLHQGTLRAALDFILLRRSPIGDAAAAELALANGLAQIETFTLGQQGKDPHREHSGNRPLSILALDEINPATLGALIALYEHKVFVQSLIWGINAFDQFGVELGKKIGTATLQALQNPRAESNLVTVKEYLVGG